VEALIKSGSMDSAKKTRQAMVEAVDRVMGAASLAKRDADSGQVSLFSMLGAAADGASVKVDDLPEWPEATRLAAERESLGFYLSGHPLDRYAEEAKRLGAIPTVELPSLRHNQEIQIAGVVASVRERVQKSGDGRWAVVVIEDTFGQAEVLVFTRVYGEAEAILRGQAPVLVRGRNVIDDVSDEGQQVVPKMRADAFELLEAAEMKRTRHFEIRVDVLPKKPDIPRGFFDVAAADAMAFDDVDAGAFGRIEDLKAALARFPGETPLRLVLEMPARYLAVLEPPGQRVRPCDALIDEVLRVPGVREAVRR
jgi:DNA polymerase III alpha subunit